MRIVHVVRQFHPGVGGIESVVLELASAQRAEGHDVRVVTLDRLFNAPQGRKLPGRDSVAGIEVVRIPFFGSSRYPIAPSVLGHLGGADVVHVHAIDFFCDFLAWTRPLHRKRLVISTHGGFFHTQFAARLKRFYFNTVTRLSLAWCDAVAAVSAADRELFGRIRKRGIVCIENGVNVSRYADASSAVPARTILTLGRLANNKRLDRLICFLAALRRRDPQWKLVIVGRRWDVEETALKTLAEAQHVGDAVEIVGGSNEHTIRRLMGRSSVIASASEYEGFGLAAVEGLSAGLFPLLSDIPPFRRLVTGAGVGMLVDFSDAETAAERFAAKWREVEADYSRYRARSVQAASAYDWRQVSAAYAELYEQVCGAKRRTIKTRTILGVPICVGTRSQTVELLDGRFERGESAVVAFANAHLLNIASRAEQFRRILQKVIVVNDGIGVDIASLFLFGSTFPNNLNGTDFTPHYLANTRHRYRIFLLGSRPGVAEKAARYLSRHCPRHRIVGCHHGYFSEEGSAGIVNMVKSSGADVILVAMGNPLQERWLADNLAATGCRLGFAVGALFDFVTGHSRRAPRWVQAARLEWAHRLLHEPRRLWRRYLLGNPLFLLRVFGQWLSGAQRHA